MAEFAVRLSGVPSASAKAPSDAIACQAIRCGKGLRRISTSVPGSHWSSPCLRQRSVLSGRQGQRWEVRGWCALVLGSVRFSGEVVECLYVLVEMLDARLRDGFRAVERKAPVGCAR